MEEKKISFGFMKTKKVTPVVEQEKKDFIECLEDQSIKIVGGEEVKENEPLVIPMKPNTLITAERLKEIAAEVESSLQEPETTDQESQVVNIYKDVDLRPLQKETLDEMAVRELLQESNKEVEDKQGVMTVPVPSLPVIDGKPESTLEDYEAVPVQDFGLAILRGMGWKPGKDQSKYKQPELRPKGLGLGADKVIKANQKKKSNNNGETEELAIIKNSYVKVIAGKYKGYYGKVLSLDEDTGRVMVDLAVKKETLNLNEFMMQPVTKAEFDKESKVINTDAYQEYKKNERSQSERPAKTESHTLKEKLKMTSLSNPKEGSSSQRSNDTLNHSRDVNAERGRKEVRDKRKDHEKSSNGRDNKKRDVVTVDSSSEEDKERKLKRISKDKLNKRDSSSGSEDRSKNRKVKRSDVSSSDDNRSRQNNAKKLNSRSQDKNVEHVRMNSSSDEEDNKRQKIDKINKTYIVEHKSRRREKDRRDSSSSEEDMNRETRYKRRDGSEDRNRVIDKVPRDHSSREDNKKRKEKDRNRDSSEDRTRRIDKDRRGHSSREEYKSIQKKVKERENSEDRYRRMDKERSKKVQKERRDPTSSEEDRSNTRMKEKYKRDSSSEERSRKTKDKRERGLSSNKEDQVRKAKMKYKKNDSSDQSLNSVSNYEAKKKIKVYREQDSSDSESEVEKHKKEKRDIDKKRKGKKKRRDRSRSPNYKKYRK